MMEQQAGHMGADVLVSSDPAAVLDLAAKGLFVPFKPEGFDKVPAGLNDPDGRFVAQRVSVISIYGRTDLFPLSDMPKTWDDLLSPRFKGKLVMTNPSFTSLQLGVVAMMAKLRGWDFFERLNRNDVVVVQGNEQALNLVKTGERPIAAGADSQYANEARHRRAQDRQRVSERRHLCDPGDDLGRQGLEEPERRQAARRIHAEPRGAEAVAARAASTRRAPTSIRRPKARGSATSR